MSSHSALETRNSALRLCRKGTSHLADHLHVGDIDTANLGPGRLGEGVCAVLAQSLADYLDILDRHHDRIPLDVIQEGLENVTVGYDDVRQYARFSPDHYVRNLIRAGPAYQALLLCWRNGQRSPIHDHRGSNCGFLVVRGVVTESVFERNSRGLIYPTVSRRMSEGTVCVSRDDDIHQVSNLEDAGDDLITLHLYSPPLLVMGQYSLTDATVREWVDPVCELTSGAGI